jgi:adenylate cyclase
MRPDAKTATFAGLFDRAGKMFRRPRKVHLPARVERQIDRRRRDSELLISAVQAGLIVVFSLLYFVARKTAPPMGMLHPVPCALGVYATFTLFRLWLALRDRVSRIIQALSVVIDVVVLMITIWSFHLQYHEPAAFYLRADPGS